MNTFIYILLENDIPFYVGKTKNPNRRGKNHKRKYPNSLFEVVDEVTISEWKFWEKYYISLYRSWGFSLVNRNSGGGGSETIKEETKRKISIAMKGKKNPMFHKTHSKEIRAIISKMKKGKKFSKEHKNKLSESHKGKVHTKETREKLSRPRKSRKSLIKSSI